MIRYTLMTLAPRPTLPPGYSRFAIGSSPSSSPMPLAFKYICLSFISATCGNTWEFYYICSFRSSFLSVQTGSEDSSIGDPVIHLLSEWVTFWFWNTQQDPSHLWPLRHILGVMKKHDLTNKKTTTNTKTMMMTSTLREHSKSNLCYLWHLLRLHDKKTWPDQKNTITNTNTMTNTFREHL